MKKISCIAFGFSLVVLSVLYVGEYTSEHCTYLQFGRGSLGLPDYFIIKKLRLVDGVINITTGLDNPGRGFSGSVSVVYNPENDKEIKGKVGAEYIARRTRLEKKEEFYYNTFKVTLYAENQKLIDTEGRSHGMAIVEKDGDYMRFLGFFDERFLEKFLYNYTDDLVPEVECRFFYLYDWPFLVEVEKFLRK